jgi:protein SCO1/2
MDMDSKVKRELSRAAAGAAVFVLLITALAVNAQWFPAGARAAVPAEYLGDELLPPRSAPAFDLIDRTGERLQLDSLRGGPVLLSFAFTNCATICPLIFSSFKGVEKGLEERGIEDVALVFITLDPDLDTPERLQQATEYVGGHWHFLSEDQPTLEKVWSAYNIYRKKAKGVVEHAGVTYLIDGKGLMRLRYAGTPLASAILNDIERLRANP